MAIRFAEPREVRWFHLTAILLGLEAAGWLLWGCVLPLPSTLNRLYFPGLILVVVAAGTGALLAFVCRERRGLAAPLALGLCLIWGKDKTIQQQVAAEIKDRRIRPGYTGLADFDILMLLAATGALIAMLARHSRLDVEYLPAVVLASLALVMLGLLPGVPSVNLSPWKLCHVATDDKRLAAIVDMLRTRIGSADEVLDLLRRNERGPEAKVKEETPSPGKEPLICEYTVSMLRTPVVVDEKEFFAEPQVIAQEKIVLHVDRARLEALRLKNRTAPLAFHESLEDHVNRSRSSEIFELCLVLEALFRKHGLSPWDRLQTILGFCQEPNIRYTHDDSKESMRDLRGTQASDYCRYPLETLVDREGDCDCHAVLAACLFDTLGYDCCVIFLRTKDKEMAHMAVGVTPPGAQVRLTESLCPRMKGRFYCETTGRWRIGRMPDDMDPDSIEVRWPERS